MNIRVFNQKILEPAAIAFSVFGIIFLCQPWVQVLHAWSVLIMLIGLIAFNVSVHIPPPVQKIDEDDTGPVSVRETVQEGHGHG
jgi:hypothetical protein